MRGWRWSSGVSADPSSRTLRRPSRSSMIVTGGPPDDGGAASMRWVKDIPEADNFEDGVDAVTVDRCLAHRCVAHRHERPHPYEPECGVCMNEAIANTKTCPEHN